MAEHNNHSAHRSPIEHYEMGRTDERASVDALLEKVHFLMIRLDGLSKGLSKAAQYALRVLDMDEIREELAGYRRQTLECVEAGIKRGWYPNAVQGD